MGIVAQYQQSTFTAPVNATTADATQVLGNDNNLRAKFNAHDADATIHLQTTTLASRPAAGTAGRPWLTTDGRRLYLDTGAAWEEFVLALAGGTMTGALLMNYDSTSAPYGLRIVTSTTAFPAAARLDSAGNRLTLGMDDDAGTLTNGSAPNSAVVIVPNGQRLRIYAENGGPVQSCAQIGADAAIFFGLIQAIDDIMTSASFVQDRNAVTTSLYCFRGSNASGVPLASGVAGVLFDIAGVPVVQAGTYYVTAACDAVGPSVAVGSAILLVGAFGNAIAMLGGSAVTISLVGNNVMGTQTTGVATNIGYTCFRVA